MGKMTKHEMAEFFGVPYNTVIEAVLELNNGRSTRKKDMTFDVEAVRVVLLKKYDAALDRVNDDMAAYSAMRRRVELAGKG